MTLPRSRGFFSSILTIFIFVFTVGGVKLGGTVYEHKTAKFGKQPGEYDLTNPSQFAVPIDGCTPIAPNSLTNKVALIKRGGLECYFVDKVWRAQQAGAVGVIVGAVSSNTKLLTMFAKEDNPNAIEIPAVFVEYNTFEILSAHVGEDVTMNEEGEQANLYDPLHWEFAKSFLVVLPIIFIASCLFYMILKYVKRVFISMRRTESARRLPTISYSTGSIHNANCCICLEDFETNERTKVLPCGHGYHPGCIDEWLTDHSDLCPMCKRSVNSEPTHALGTSNRCERLKAMCNCCPVRRTRARTPGPRLLSQSEDQNAVQAV